MKTRSSAGNQPTPPFLPHPFLECVEHQAESAGENLIEVHDQFVMFGFQILGHMPGVLDILTLMPDTESECLQTGTSTKFFFI